MTKSEQYCYVFFILGACLLAEGTSTYPKCVPFKCLMKCPFGQQTDTFGCPICSCRPRPICPLIKCPSIDCRYGFLEVNGCRTCRCKPAPSKCPVSNCRYIKCHGLHKHVDINGCESCSCGLLPTPPPKCPVSNCLFIKCRGLQKHFDRNGCESCTCRPIPHPLWSRKKRQTSKRKAIETEQSK